VLGKNINCFYATNKALSTFFPKKEKQSESSTHSMWSIVCAGYCQSLSLRTLSPTIFAAKFLQTSCAKDDFHISVEIWMPFGLFTISTQVSRIK